MYLIFNTQRGISEHDTSFQDGHTVTGTVRSLSKGDQLLSIHPEWKDKLNFIEVPHLSQHGVWDAVFQNGHFDYVIHNAAPVPSNLTNLDFDRDFLGPGLLGYVVGFF
jgi:nucleoside-diphosphate-sugar epimerase